MTLAIVMVFLYLVKVKGQETGLSPLPSVAIGPVTGDGFQLPNSGTLLISSVLVSLIAFLLN
ncbi:tRNA 5-methylaminomethyl-2-thiouridine biosynthesis bifunctional protein MnmC [Bienertia sinuspersici]